jgi:hypothetical protein
VDGCRIAGSGGIGEGDLPVRPWNAVVDREGELAACEPENEDRLEPGLVIGGSIS